MLYDQGGLRGPHVVWLGWALGIPVGAIVPVLGHCPGSVPGHIFFNLSRLSGDNFVPFFLFFFTLFASQSTRQDVSNPRRFTEVPIGSAHVTHRIFEFGRHSQIFCCGAEAGRGLGSTGEFCKARFFRLRCYEWDQTSQKKSTTLFYSIFLRFYIASYPKKIHFSPGQSLGQKFFSPGTNGPWAFFFHANDAWACQYPAKPSRAQLG